jgi:hypothetical protein
MKEIAVIVFFAEQKNNENQEKTEAQYIDFSGRGNSHAVFRCVVT